METASVVLIVLITLTLQIKGVILEYTGRFAK